MTNMTPLVSVCIANFNGMGVIDDCLRSVLEQQGLIRVEILVHDDASADGSAAHIRSRYPDVKLIEGLENVGYCVSNNRMADEARGEYLLLLNNDAVLLPDALQTLLAEAKRIDRPVILGLPQYDAASGELVDIGSLFDPFLNPVPNRDPQRRDVGMVIGACLWIPKILWDELGGFPEWFGSIAEDMYLCCRARLKGYEVRALPVSGYRHWQGKSFGGNRVTDNRLSSTFRRRALSERNKSFVMIICSPTPALLLILPFHLLVLAAEGGLLALVKRDLQLWRGIYWACFCCLWKERQRLSRTRAKVQAARYCSLTEWVSAFTVMPHKLRLLVRHGFPEVTR